jgi:bla regulator protein BlaR1
MQLLNLFLSGAAARAICWTLIHSLWQGALIAALAGLIIYGTRKLPAVLRYNLLGIDLLLFLLLAGMTFGYELREGAPGSGAAPALSVTVPGLSAAAGALAAIPPADHSDIVQRISDYVNTHALVITAIWLACLLFQLLRLGGGLYQVRRIRRNTSLPAGNPWVERLSVLSSRLRIRRPVTLLESAGVRTPSAIGWWKPTILVPLGLLANLPPDQVETILLHELAHIRRNDYVTNLVLYLTEAVFFFNPGLRWVATLLRREREACCDDMVLAGTPDRNSYLVALVTFTQWIVDEKPGGIQRYTLQFGGGKTDLLWRVRRMVNQENKKLQPAEKLILSFGLMALLSIGLVGMHPATLHPATLHPAMLHPAPRVNSRSILAQHIDTIPTPTARSRQKQVTIEQLSIHSWDNNDGANYHAIATDKDGNHYDLRRKNGQVTEFHLNGQLIPKEEYDSYSAIFDSIESARKNIKITAAPATPAAPAIPAAPAGPATLSAPSMSTPPMPAMHSAPPTPATHSAPPTPPTPVEHAPTPEDPMVYNTFHNPYAKQMLLDLIKDGLAGDLNHISFVLNADKMTVNDILQPDNIFQIYRARYIQHPGDHMIYSQYYTPQGSGTHCECIHQPDMPAPVN